MVFTYAADAPFGNAGRIGQVVLNHHRSTFNIHWLRHINWLAIDTSRL